MRSGWGGGRILVGAALVVLGGCAHAAATPPQDAASAPPDTPDFSNGATQTLHMTQKDVTRYATVEDYLQGRVAGLQVIPLGGGQYSLRIRGTTSINMSQEPLVVIDGVPVPPEGTTNALAAVSPNQIKDVQILKDAGSTAWYGIRGANGVIVITTKRGTENQ